MSSRLQLLFFYAFHQKLMIYKLILKCPRELLLKGILYRSKFVACKVNNHLLTDLVYEVVYWVSVSWTHTVGVPPRRLPWQPRLVRKKLGWIAYTPRKGKMKLPPAPSLYRAVLFLFLVLILVSHNSFLILPVVEERASEQGHLSPWWWGTVLRVSVWVWEWVFKAGAALQNWSLSLGRNGASDRKNSLSKTCHLSSQNLPPPFPHSFLTGCLNLT